MDDDKLRKIIAELGTRPGHEKVRSLLYRLLVEALGMSSEDISFEKQLPEVHGRADVILGRTVFEIKSDLRREQKAAETQLTNYLPDRERETHERYIGITTDGADFQAHVYRNGELQKVNSHETNIESPRDLLIWLQGAMAIGEQLQPELIVIQKEFGKGSIAAWQSLEDLNDLWMSVKNKPEAGLKFKLWNEFLSLAYGKEVGDEKLFLQHTYLVIVAKAMARAALVDGLPLSGEALLRGQAFRDSGITGQDEPDFFDWILQAEGGDDFIMRLVRQVSRFKLNQIKVDILKGLYESLIDPETRHDLGEYYTPDWLAARICREAVRKPLEERVMDPACGSGTFLFHAVRNILDEANKKKMEPKEAISLAIEKVAGIEVHPVAVIFARATFLLALLPALKKGRPKVITLPVYLGDSLQWNLRQIHEEDRAPGMLAKNDNLEIIAPAIMVGEGKKLKKLAEIRLLFPESVVKNPADFDTMLQRLIELASKGAQASDFNSWLEQKRNISREDCEILMETYKKMCVLQKQDRNHIWGYIARNLARPVWLSSDGQKADVVIGNPPWVALRYMDKDKQERFRQECKAVDLWVGKQVATHQDLSAYFYIRAASLYMKRDDGRLAMIMPQAALSRKPYQKFRTGRVIHRGFLEFYLRFTGAWGFGPDVQPLFPVPSCVLFAERHAKSDLAPLPNNITAFAGDLPQRNADEEQANRALTKTSKPWPPLAEDANGSLYRKRFRQGATLVPRRFILVEEVSPSGQLPRNPHAPIVRGRVGNLDKSPWKNIKPPQGPIEKQFLRSALLGESVAPFRLLEPVCAVIPWEEKYKGLMTAKKADKWGHDKLAAWLKKTEALWEQHKQSNMSLLGRIDYHRELSSQFSSGPIIASMRVVYTASGTNMAACVIKDKKAIIDSGLYWARCQSVIEGHYLCAIMNSETLRERVAKYQSQGQWGRRHFSKDVFNLPIPLFKKDDALHKELGAAAKEAEKIAAQVPLDEGKYFTHSRKRIRNALVEHGIAGKIDALVVRLLA